jgi:hypothetical protein
MAQSETALIASHSGRGMRTQRLRHSSAALTQYKHASSHYLRDVTCVYREPTVSPCRELCQKFSSGPLVRTVQAVAFPPDLSLRYSLQYSQTVGSECCDPPHCAARMKSKGNKRARALRIRASYKQAIAPVAAVRPLLLSAGQVFAGPRSDYVLVRWFPPQIRAPVGLQSARDKGTTDGVLVWLNSRSSPLDDRPQGGRWGSASRAESGLLMVTVSTHCASLGNLARLVVASETLAHSLLNLALFTIRQKRSKEETGGRELGIMLCGILEALAFVFGSGTRIRRWVRHIVYVRTQR